MSEFIIGYILGAISYSIFLTWWAKKYGEKIQPRRIVLEETDQKNGREANPYYIQHDGISLQVSSDKWWKEVKE